MPTGTPYNGHIPPYNNIRIDAFSSPRNAGSVNYKSPDLLLLTHTHSDHVHGLASKSFGLPLYCSADARAMLLRHESEQERRKYPDPGTHGSRLYAHLESTIVAGNGKARFTRKLLNVLPMNQPTVLQIGLTDERVRITAIDANHCPGGVMYLIEGQHGAVLHTGDVRCEPAFIDSLKRNPFLRPYIAPPTHLTFPSNTSPSGKGKEKAQEAAPPKRLEAIYLDTACMMFRSELPSKVIQKKESAVEGLVKLMSRYPSYYKFFINSWTWGYEEALIGIATCFGVKIHVDRYKYDIYTSLSEPIWKEILTMDPTATRFHACARFDRCSEVEENVTGCVVYVNPNDMGLAGWHAYQQRVLEEMSCGNFPSALRFGLCRHSSLPELKALVGLFRPNRIVPNTVYPNMRGADWANIPYLFRDELPPGAGDRIWEEMRANGVGRHLSKDDYLSPGGQPRTLLDYEELEALRAIVEEIIGDHKFDEGLDLVRSVDVHVLLHETFGGKRLVEMEATNVPQGVLDLLRGNLQHSVRKQAGNDEEDTDDEKGLRSADEDEDEDDCEISGSPAELRQPTKVAPVPVGREPSPVRSAGRLPTPPSEPQSPVGAVMAWRANLPSGSSFHPKSTTDSSDSPNPVPGNATKTRNSSFMFTMVNPDSVTPSQSPSKSQAVSPSALRTSGKPAHSSAAIRLGMSRKITRMGSASTSTAVKAQKSSKEVRISSKSRFIARSSVHDSPNPSPADPGPSAVSAHQRTVSFNVSFTSEANTTVGSVVLMGETKAPRSNEAKNDGEREAKRRKVMDVLIPQTRRSPVATRASGSTPRPPVSPISRTHPPSKNTPLSSKPLRQLIIPVPPPRDTEPPDPELRKTQRRTQKELERKLSTQLELANPTYFKPSEEYVLEHGKRKALEKGLKRARGMETKVKKESPEVPPKKNKAKAPPPPKATPAEAPPAKVHSFSTTPRPFKNLASKAATGPRKAKAVKIMLLAERDRELAEVKKMRKQREKALAEKRKEEEEGEGAMDVDGPEGGETKKEEEEPPVEEDALICYSTIEAPPSLIPATRYCDITGLEAPYTDPLTGLRYHDKDVFAHIRTLKPSAVQSYLSLRGGGQPVIV
ncbi:hypothetical protein FRC04_010503 [Tulasnella sp. 424]|nr:hypothetical protein FRC04_010503 [Tulasnella sp. 424]